MNEELLLVGLLAEPAMMAALGLKPLGAGVVLPGRLVGGARAGVAADGWPGWDRDTGLGVAALPVAATAALRRYAAIMRLLPVETGQGRALGFGPVPQLGGDGDLAESRPDAALAAALAEELVTSDQPVDTVRARLPMIAWRVASRLRATVQRGAALPPGPAFDERSRIEARTTPYANYFAVEELRFRHRLHRGGWSGPIDRAVFISGDSVVVLPWDPLRDRVLLVDQFRAGPAARGDGQPWLYEPVAGRIDAGETPESTALREAWEEAGVTLTRLVPAPGCYPSPGIVAEYIYAFVGIADLPDGAATVAGVADEGEDIQGHLIDRAELTRMALDGRIVEGPLLILALWLDRMADTLRADLAVT